jgi:hypothetical protein
VELDAPVQVDPGDYDVRAQAPGCRDYEHPLSVASGARRTLSIALMPTPPPPPHEHEGQHDLWLGLPPWVWITAGGAVAASVGGYFLFKPGTPKAAPFNCAATGATIDCAELR